jgi:hypothetical protein
VPERSNGTVLKTVVPERVPWVRIPPSPPSFTFCEIVRNSLGAKRLGFFPARRRGLGRNAGGFLNLSFFASEFRILQSKMRHRERFIYIFIKISYHYSIKKETFILYSIYYNVIQLRKICQTIKLRIT